MGDCGENFAVLFIICCKCAVNKNASSHNNVLGRIQKVYNYEHVYDRKKCSSSQMNNNNEANNNTL